MEITESSAGLMFSVSDIVNKGLWRLFPVINCDRIEDIPVDYPGVIGVPITIAGKLSPEQFEICGMLRPKIKGKELYCRILIRHLHPILPEHIDLNEWLERSGSKYYIAVEATSP